MTLLFALLIAFIAFCTVLVIGRSYQESQRRKSLRERLSNDGDEFSAQATDAALDFGGELSDQAQKMSGLLSAMGINVDRDAAKLEHRFHRAGIMSKDGPIKYMFFKRVGTVVFVLLGGLTAFTAEDDLLLQICGGILIFLGLFGPDLYLKNAIDKRTKRLQRAFPDTLDLLLICVESGLSLDAGLLKICSELAAAHPDMTFELNRTRLELTLLNDRVKALTNLADRTDMVAFRSLVVALVQSERFGTSLVDTLRVLADDFRLQRMAVAETKAARLPVLLTLPLIFLLMPAFIIIVVGPAMITLSKSKGDMP